jgi:DNA-binding MarR family transcriptional regulator
MWLDDDQQRVWRQYLDMSRLLTAHLTEHYQRGHGLSAADYEVLVNLSESPTGRMRAFELGEQTQWEKSRLSHHLTRMEKRGLVHRSTTEGGRYPDVVVTDAGRAAIAAAAPDHAALVRELFFDELSEEQLAMFAEVCSTVSAKVRAHMETACPLSDC